MRTNSWLFQLLIAVSLTASCARSGFESWPCQGKTCSGHGTCRVTTFGEPLCVCDPGFLNSNALECTPYSTLDASFDALWLDGRGGEGGGADGSADAGAMDRAAADGAGSDAMNDSGQPADAAALDLTPADRTTPTDGTADGTADGTVADASVADAGLSPTGTWIHIPGGSFAMGCTNGDPDCLASESPSHTVTVAAFDMLATEITQAQYLAVMGANPSKFSEAGDGNDCGLDCPVEQIEWQEAKDYCAAIGGRLPSEAEWEYAARAGATTRYACGDDQACLDSVAWYSANSNSTTHPVATKDANDFGLYDMHGNVWEWVEDCWHANYVGAPTTGEVWAGGDCGLLVLRGGSWEEASSNQRASSRNWGSPGFTLVLAGARCAK